MLADEQTECIYSEILIDWKKNEIMTFARNCMELGILNEISSLRQQNTMLYTEFKITYVCIFAYMCADYEARPVIMSMLEELLMWGCRENHRYIGHERRMDGCLRGGSQAWGKLGQGMIDEISNCLLLYMLI